MSDDEKRIIEPSRPIIEVTKPQGITAQVLGHVTLDRNGTITHGVMIDGPNTCGFRICNIPVTAKKVKITLEFNRMPRPFWWSAKHQRIMDRYMLDYRNAMVAKQKNAQKVCQPTGLRTDI